MYLITKWFGTFLCNKTGVKEKILFPKNEKEISKRLIKIKDNQILTEEKKLSKGLDLIVNEKRLSKIGDYSPSDSFFKKIDIKPKDYNFSEDLLQKASLIASQKQTDEKLESPDLQIIQMINTLDDLIHTSNLLLERLDCWYEINPSKEKMKPLENSLQTVKKEITALENQIEKDMKEIAPNISAIAGPLIGARLIKHANGIDKLALLPASTIQILGAEKALFRFKKEGGRPPKHGVIFQHSLINKSPKAQRGKIARVMATKISTASKADVFTKRDISNMLKKDLKNRINEIRSL